MLSGALSWSLSTGWRLILWTPWTFNIWVRPPARSLADKGGGKGDLSDNLNAATPSCWKSDLDALTITSVSEMYPTAVICLFWARVSILVVRRFWLHCRIFKKSWTLAILCNFLFTSSILTSKSFSVFIVSNIGSAPAKITWLVRANCLTTAFLQTVSPELFDSLQPITSWPREKLASTPTPCGMIKKMSLATLERSAYFECVSSCWCQQSVMSGDQNVLLISIGLEWSTLRFGWISPRSVVLQAADSNRAWLRLMEVLRNRFAWVLSQPHCWPSRFLHHRWTNHQDQRLIDWILKPLQTGWDWWSVIFHAYWLAHVDVWRSIHPPHTKERPLGIGLYRMSRPQDSYQFLWLTFETITTSEKDGGYVQKWDPCLWLESLQHNSCTASVELTSQRTSSPSMESSA